MRYPSVVGRRLVVEPVAVMRGSISAAKMDGAPQANEQRALPSPNRVRLMERGLDSIDLWGRGSLVERIVQGICSSRQSLWRVYDVVP